MDIMKEASQIFQDDSLELIGAMLITPDEEFDTIKGTVLDAMREAANRKENQSQWSALIKQSGFTKEKYIEELSKVDDLIEKEMGEYSETKKDFMRQFFAIIYNAIIESFDKNKRIIQIPIEICNPDAKIPTYAHEGDAGADVYSPIDTSLAPGETKIIPLGFKVAIPDGYELQIRPRSGLSARTHLRVANTPATIDAGFRGEVGVILHNSAAPLLDIGDNDTPRDGALYGPSYTISKGDRIAQLVLQEVPKAIFIETPNISAISSARGENGYGSSGK